MGGPRAMKASLRKVKSQTRVHGHFGLVFFFSLDAYTTSDLRTFRRTCVHVRKECSLELSVCCCHFQTDPIAFFFFSTDVWIQKWLSGHDAELQVPVVRG